LLIEQLAAGDPVDLCAQRRDAVLIGLLKPCLAGDRGADQVVAQDQIGSGEQIADGKGGDDRAGKRGHPRPDGEVAYLVASGDDDRMRFGPFAEHRGRACFRH
jgi:hypothetical protein